MGSLGLLGRGTAGLEDGAAVDGGRDCFGHGLGGGAIDRDGEGVGFEENGVAYFGGSNGGDGDSPFGNEGVVCAGEVVDFGCVEGSFKSFTCCESVEDFGG